MAKHGLRMIVLAAVFAIVTAVSAIAQTSAATSGGSHPVEGSYAVESKSAELGTIAFQLILKREGGKWTGDIKDAPMPITVTSVAVDETNKVTIVADAGGTPVTIIGKFESDKIAGDWTAGDMKGTWSGGKKDAVVASAASGGAPAAAASGGSSAWATLEGSYDFKIVADGQGELPLTLVIKKDGDKFATEVPGGGDLLITGIDVKDPDAVTLSATYQGNGPIPLPGKRTGNAMGGKWEFGGFAGTWEAKKK
jgi:hypothetical protein